MAVDLPAVVIEADAPAKAQPLSVLRPSEVRALAAHKDATGLRAIALPAGKKSIAIVPDPERASRILRIEETLRAAREPLDLGDREQVGELRAKVALAYADARAHPEAPEAPFLVAEALRTLARVEELAGDAPSARALRVRADVLDGGRRIGLSEGGPSEPTVESAVSVSIALVEAEDATEVYVDGERRDVGKALSLAPGEHHLRIAHEGGTIVAQWLAIGDAKTQELSFRAGPGVVACSERDLERALNKSSFSVACARWLRVTRAKDAIEVSVCGATSCEPASVWSTAPLAKPKPIPTETSFLRSKWTWIGVGAAAVVGGTITAWQLGVFDRPDPPPPTWRWEGAR